MVTRRTQAERRHEAQRALLEAAIEVLGSEGVAAATLEKIGTRAGVSRGLATYHYGSKLNMIRAVVEEIRNTTVSFLEGDTPPEPGLAGLDTLIERYLSIYAVKAPHGRAFMTTMVESFTGSPELSEIVVEHNRTFVDLFIDKIHEAQDLGEVDLAADVDAMAVLIASILRGVASMWFVDPEVVDMPREIKSVQAIVRTQLTLASL